MIVLNKGRLWITFLLVIIIPIRVQIIFYNILIIWYILSFIIYYLFHYAIVLYQFERHGIYDKYYIKLCLIIRSKSTYYNSHPYLNIILYFIYSSDYLVYGIII